MINTIFLIVFILSTTVFIVAALQNYFLYKMYYNAYKNIKRSKIIETLTNLFFWKTLAFVALSFVGFSNLLHHEIASLIVRGVGIIPFIFVSYYLNEFTIWSTKNDIEEVKEVKKNE